MKKFGLPALAAILAIVTYAAPAHAQATRTWVSGVGDDANPCSRTAPCKTFPGAISKTATGGEINVLDPGGFGGVTITKSISIISDSIEAGVLVSGTNAIIVNVPDGSKVLLQGLDIEGLGTGLNGVHVVGSGKITIRKCAIRNFAGNAVNVVGTANARVLLEQSILLNNGGGFNINPAAGIANSGLILNSVLDNQTSFNVQVTGTTSIILMGSQLIGTAVGIVSSGGAVVESYGNNVLRGSGAPTVTSLLK